MKASRLAYSQTIKCMRKKGIKWVKCGLDDCVLRPAHRKPLHPASSPCQSRCLSIQVHAAARWGEYRCPAPTPPGALTLEQPCGRSSPGASLFLQLWAPSPTSRTQKNRQPPPLGSAPLPRPPPPAAPPGNYCLAPTTVRLLTPSVAWRPASEDSRKLLTPPARAPGRTPGGGVPMSRPRPKAKPLARALPPAAPLHPRPRQIPRTGAASAHAAPSERRLPPTHPHFQTLVPALPARLGRPRPGPSRPRGPGATTPARPPPPQPHGRRRSRVGSLTPAPAYRSCPAGSAALGPHDCPRPRPLALPSQSEPAPRKNPQEHQAPPPPWCRPACAAAPPPA